MWSLLQAILRGAVLQLCYKQTPLSVAVEAGGEGRFYESSSIDSSDVISVKATTFKLPDAVYQEYRNKISDPARKSVEFDGKTINQWYDLSDLGEPAFLKHAEFDSLYRLWVQCGKQPLGEVTIHSDRPICRYKNGCFDNLNKILDLFGITKLTDQSGRSAPGAPTVVMVPGREPISDTK